MEEVFFETEHDKEVVLIDKENRKRVLRIIKVKDSADYNVYEKGRKVFMVYSVVPTREDWWEIEDIGPTHDEDFEDSWYDSTLIGIGLGKLLYDIVEEDVVRAGGRGIVPSVGALSDDAITFWKKRLKNKFPVITENIGDDNLDRILRFRSEDPEDSREVHVRLKEKREVFFENFG